jgi:hypothetical protein
MDGSSRQRFYKEPGLISISAEPIGGKAAILIVDFWVLGLWEPACAGRNNWWAGKDTIPQHFERSAGWAAPSISNDALTSLTVMAVDRMMKNDYCLRAAFADGYRRTCGSLAEAGFAAFIVCSPCPLLGRGVRFIGFRPSSFHSWAPIRTSCSLGFGSAQPGARKRSWCFSAA